MSGHEVIMDTIKYDPKTKRFRSWHQHGVSDGGTFTPTGEPIEDTHKSTQEELWEMAQAVGLFAPYPTPAEPPPS